MAFGEGERWVLGLKCDAGGAGAKLSIMVEDRRWDRGKWRRAIAKKLVGLGGPPANDSCMEGPGLERTVIRKSKLSANLHLASGWGAQPDDRGKGLIRACSGNVPGSKLATSGHSVQISKRQPPIRSRHEVGRSPFPE